MQPLAPVPGALPWQQEGPQLRRPGDRGSFHTAGWTRMLLGCQRQGFVTGGGRRVVAGAPLASAGSSPLSKAEAVMEEVLISIPWVLQVETLWVAQVAVPVPSSPVSSVAGWGAGRGQAGSSRGVQMTTWRARGWPAWDLTVHRCLWKDQSVPGGPTRGGFGAGRWSAPSPV